MSRMSAALLALVLIFQVPGIVQAETPANILLRRSFYVSMEGQTQGKLKGGSMQPNRQSWMEGFWYEHSVVIPRDPQSGQPTGQRRHLPLTFVKPFDAASPQIFTALTRGERMRKVTVLFVRPGAERQEVVYATIELEDAIVVDVRRFTQGNVLLEEVSLIYRKINITDPVNGTSGADDWRAPKA